MEKSVMGFAPIVACRPHCQALDKHVLLWGLRNEALLETANGFATHNADEENL